MRQRGRDPGISISRGRQPLLRTLEIPAPEIDEPEAEARLLVRGIEAQRHLPLVGRALQLTAVRVDAGQHVVRVGDVRMAIESA